ncbi:actin-related protein [Scheffersomyces coipomensis]|uniref:actin-related protein n=1 Tax=Scheffersomyces coipomensis TaxID=1788519 RepID=UPI00315D3141
MSKQYLVIDNGSYNIKAGFNTGENSDIRPIKVQNAITKTKDGLVHIGNEYLKHSNNLSGIQFKRPYEQGHLVSWENEKPIWDYTFDQLITANAGTSNKSHKKKSHHNKDQEFDPSITHLTLTESPFQLPQLSSNTDQIVFEEYGFNEYYRCIPASLVPFVPFKDNNKSSNNDFVLVIDSGFNSTWIVPMIYQTIYWEGVRKLPIGGKLLNGLLKELISFRHYDISDDPILVNYIKEQTFVLTDDFSKALRDKQKLQCEFVLPDFKTTTTGFVKTKNTKITPDTQLLKLTDERFTIPEAYYHPEILFDNNEIISNAVLQSAPLKNLTDLVVESIMACPEITRPLLSANISVVGGSVNLKNFEHRLLSELRRELPSNWFVRIREDKGFEKDEMSWLGGINLTNNDVLDNISVSKQEYFEHGANWCQKQFGFKNLS